MRVLNLTRGGHTMSALEQLEQERGNKEYMELTADSTQNHTVRARTASNEMCTFLVMNISSLQLIPVNIIAYRSQYGSANLRQSLRLRLWRRFSVPWWQWCIVR